MPPRCFISPAAESELLDGEGGIAMLDRLQGKVMLIPALGFALAAIFCDADDVVAAAPVPRQTDDCGQLLRAIFGQQQVAEDGQVIAALKDYLLACVAGEFFLFQNARS